MLFLPPHSPQTSYLSLMAAPQQQQQQPHVVIFPFMAKGHTIPLLDLSKTLSYRGLSVTIVTTPANSPFILHSTSAHPQIRIAELDFPLVEGLPKGCESTDKLPSLHLYVSFQRATKHLRRLFERLLRHMSDAGTPPTCVISDFFLGWTLPVCRDLGVPRLVFHGMGVFAMAVCKAGVVHAPHLQVNGDDQTFSVPGIPASMQITPGDLPEVVRNFDPTNDPFAKFIAEDVGLTDVESDGIVVNSFVEMEGEYMAALESFYKGGARAWCVGPTLLFDRENDVGSGPDESSVSRCVEWLDRRSPRSVIYVSFGTQTHVSEAQLDEAALGLEMSGVAFVWAVRSMTWSPPQGWEERVKERGLIIREWAPQRRILQHPAMGGFLSHCGWNSVLESLSIGVPILAWPMMAEQRLNAKFVCDVLGAGAKIAGCTAAAEGADVVVGREAICQGVEEVMRGEKGRRLRERAEELSRAAGRAIAEGGSSDMAVDEMIKEFACRAQ